MLFLVVDDDALSRDLLTLLLEAEGHQVEAAVSGETAIAQFALRVADKLPLPDVVLADMQMPGLTGTALAAELTPLRDPSTVLLAMSGSRPSDLALTAFDGFLLKPFQVSELTTLIEAIASMTEVSTCEPTVTTSQTPPLHDFNFDPNDCDVGALDLEIYGNMCELMPAAQLAQMYALCLNDARKRIAHMGALAAAGDDAQFRREAHSVKGGCGMMGAAELSTLAAAAEQTGLRPPTANSDTSSGTTSVTAILARLSTACDRLERILEQRTDERTRR